MKEYLYICFLKLADFTEGWGGGLRKPSIIYEGIFVHMLTNTFGKHVYLGRYVIT